MKDCVEIGWRLGKEYWGHGYATEAAKASLAIAFERLKLSEVYSFTSKLNNKVALSYGSTGNDQYSKEFRTPYGTERQSITRACALQDK